MFHKCNRSTLSGYTKPGTSFATIVKVKIHSSTVFQQFQIIYFAIMKIMM